jgi:D-alanyl-D-alanine carboxypeptidase/D-alanyl-D-alanine-endopeptidase (penicillin-binding protein 4)
LLGPDFVFETVLSASAAISTDGAIGGDLVLIGSGDPTLAIADLEELATAAVAAGLKSVSGRVIADARAFPEAGASDHWNWGDVGNAYGAGIYGLNIEHNRCTVRFNPGFAPGEPASFLGASIDLPGVQWTNLVGTGEEGSGDGVVIHSGPYSPLVTLRGTVPAGEPGFAVRGAIPDPPGVAAYLLDRALRARGVTLGAEPQTARITAAPEAPVRIAAHRSAPIRDFIPHLHAVSDNVEAQSLFLKMGGADAVRELWAKRGVEFAGLRLEDGSGLARASRIRPLDLARANHLTRRGPHGALFHESLSASRGGAVRSKGGAMSGVRADTGFFTREDGTELTYTIIANGLTKGADFWAFRDAVLDAVSSK